MEQTTNTKQQKNINTITHATKINNKKNQKKTNIYVLKQQQLINQIKTQTTTKQRQPTKTQSKQPNHMTQILCLSVSS